MVALQLDKTDNMSAIRKYPSFLTSFITSRAKMVVKRALQISRVKVMTRDWL